MSRREKLLAALAAVFAVLAISRVLVSMPAEAVPVSSAELVVDQQAGADDADQLDSALNAWAAAPLGAKPTVVFSPNNVIDLTQRNAAPGQPYQLQDGMHFQCLSSIGREFKTNCKVRVQGGSALFRLKQGSNVQTRDISMVGIEWEGATSTHFFEPVTDFAAGPILSYSDLADSGWSGFNTVMQVRVLGVRLERFYVNGSDHTPFKWAGSDSLMADGFLDSPYLDDTEYLLWFPHLSHTEIRKVFATCDGPTCLRVDGSYRLHVNGGDYESQGAPRAAAGAAILINGGFVDLDQVATQDTNCNLASAGRSTDRGRITINGGVVRVMNLQVGNRNAGCTAPPADLVDVQVNGGKALVYYGLRQSGADITIRKLTSNLVVKSDLPVAIG
jgi:hypothetical protein